MEELSIFSVPQPHIYTVSELTEDIRQILEEEFPFIWVEGEVSNARRPLSGHLYFTLKDEKAQILCILFKNLALWQHIRCSQIPVYLNGIQNISLFLFHI